MSQAKWMVFGLLLGGGLLAAGYAIGSGNAQDHPIQYTPPARPDRDKGGIASASLKEGGWEYAYLYILSAKKAVWKGPKGGHEVDLERLRERFRELGETAVNEETADASRRIANSVFMLDVINTKGIRDWELVAVINDGDGSFVCWFKRPRE